MASTAAAATAMGTESPSPPRLPSGCTIPIATALPVMTTTAAELTIFPANETFRQQVDVQEEPVAKHKECCGCCCNNKHAIWILNLCFFCLYGILWLGLHLVDKENDGDELVQALGIVLLVILAALVLAIASAVTTCIQWNKNGGLPVGLKVLGFVPAVVMVVLLVVAKSRGSSGDNDETLGNDDDQAPGNNLRW